ncbi:MAG: hypothetical protein M1820_002899 [Bogoriella megaspora]|nr:MAG: hypothetical protein M1820_002899 [Bogoriella megaspora]
MPGYEFPGLPLSPGGDSDIALEQLEVLPSRNTFRQNLIRHQALQMQNSSPLTFNAAPFGRSEAVAKSPVESIEESTRYGNNVTIANLTRHVHDLAKEVLVLRRENAATQESIQHLSHGVSRQSNGSSKIVDTSSQFSNNTWEHVSSSESAESSFRNANVADVAEKDSIVMPALQSLEDPFVDRRTMWNSDHHSTSSDLSEATTMREMRERPLAQSVGPMMDGVKPTIEDTARQCEGWQPLAVRRMPTLNAKILSSVPSANTMESFSFDFLRQVLGGEEHSPGLYYAKGSILPSNTWFALDARFEPYLPDSPGKNGAKLTAFFNENLENSEEDAPSYINVPVFICNTKWLNSAKEHRFVYYGTYSQTRWSDKLDFDRVVEAVPHDVKMYWAEQLSAVGRPRWVTDALIKHFWPQPTYEGALPEEDDDLSKSVIRDATDYLRELMDWQKDAKMKVSLLKKENILSAFEAADANEEPGLRLWLEYLQCDNWDHNLYDGLAKRKRALPA